MGAQPQLAFTLYPYVRSPDQDAERAVLHGADDPLVPVLAGRDTATHIRGAQLEIIEGMGHDFPPALMQELAVRVIAHCRAAQPADTAPVTLPVTA